MKTLRIGATGLPGVMALATISDAAALRFASEGKLSLGTMMNGAAVVLGVSATSFLTSLAAGSVFATMVDPYDGLGLGVTTYQTFGAVPGQLAFDAATGRVKVGATAAVANASYALGITATSGDGSRSISETLVFQAWAALGPTTASYPRATASGTTIVSFTGLAPGEVVTNVASSVVALNKAGDGLALVGTLGIANAYYSGVIGTATITTNLGRTLTITISVV